MDITAQRIFSTPEYTVISETGETVFVEDETGAARVFTREEWQKMNGGGIGGIGLAALVAAAALLFIA